MVKHFPKILASEEKTTTTTKHHYYNQHIENRSRSTKMLNIYSFIIVTHPD